MNNEKSTNIYRIVAAIGFIAYVVWYIIGAFSYDNIENPFDTYFLVPLPFIAFAVFLFINKEKITLVGLTIFSGFLFVRYLYSRIIYISIEEFTVEILAINIFLSIAYLSLFVIILLCYIKPKFLTKIVLLQIWLVPVALLLPHTIIGIKSRIMFWDLNMFMLNIIISNLIMLVSVFSLCNWLKLSYKEKPYLNTPEMPTTQL